MHQRRVSETLQRATIVELPKKETRFYTLLLLLNGSTGYMPYAGGAVRELFPVELEEALCVAGALDAELLGLRVALEHLKPVLERCQGCVDAGDIWVLFSHAVLVGLLRFSYGRVCPQERHVVLGHVNERRALRHGAALRVLPPICLLISLTCFL